MATKQQTVRQQVGPTHLYRRYSCDRYRSHLSAAAALTVTVTDRSVLQFFCTNTNYLITFLIDTVESLGLDMIVEITAFTASSQESFCLEVMLLCSGGNSLTEFTISPPQRQPELRRT